MLILRIGPARASVFIRSSLGAGSRRFGSAVQPVRGDFARLAPEDLVVFRRILGDQGGVITEQEAVKTHNEDWLGRYRGRGGVVLRPGSTEEVAEVLRHCNSRRIAVVPQGE